MMKKDKNELKNFDHRTSLGCCLSGFFFNNSKYKFSSNSFNNKNFKNKDLKVKDSVKDDNSLEKKEKLESIQLEAIKLGELKSIQYPVTPPRPLLPPPYYPSVIPLLEFDDPKPKENYASKGFPDNSTIQNSETKKRYIIGKLLGKGGFAKCFELTDEDSQKIYAGKIISKICLTKVKQKEKIIKEIELHSCLKHRHIVRFHNSFEDASNVYIILENCSRKSLLHVLKSRKTITEYETRYYLRQLIDGVAYIHSQCVIHRDLKLGNMLLNDKMQVKIADFGLATKVEYPGEMKMTVCGTPNYIAPEVLQKKGHSYEADIWAIGCIMYALLVGQPPFETHSLKETYIRITANVFKVPSFVSSPSKHLIQHLLKSLPSSRPTLPDILNKDFFTHSFTPKHLPTLCCEKEPNFADFKKPKRCKTEHFQRIQTGVFVETSSNNNNNNNYDIYKNKNSNNNNNNNNNQNNFNVQKRISEVKCKTKVIYASKCQIVRLQKKQTFRITDSVQVENNKIETDPTDLIFKYGKTSTFHLYEALSYCLNNPGERTTTNFRPKSIAHFHPTWITKWVDYSNKYGFGFQLSDRNVGILFNDTTRMLISTDKRTLAYNDLSNQTTVYPIKTTPSSLRKKVTLLMYFSQYMEEHLIHGAEVSNDANKCTHNDNRRSSLCERVFVKKWFRTDLAIVMQLSNGTIQVNFLADHTKLIISCEDTEYLVTYIDHRRKAFSYRLLSIWKHGCESDILEKLKFTKRMVENIINFCGETV